MNVTPAAAVAARGVPRVRLRPTLQSDLEYVLTLEQDPQNLPFITPWERTQHEAAIRFPDFATSSSRAAKTGRRAAS